MKDSPAFFISYSQSRITNVYQETVQMNTKPEKFIDSSKTYYLWPQIILILEHTLSNQSCISPNIYLLLTQLYFVLLKGIKLYKKIALDPPVLYLLTY